MAASGRADLVQKRHKYATGPVYPKGPAWQRVFGRRLFDQTLFAQGESRLPGFDVPCGNHSRPGPGRGRIEPGDLQIFVEKMRVKTGKRQAMACIL